MAWTTPRTWVPGELVTASMMNTHVRDNSNSLRSEHFSVGAYRGLNVRTGYDRVPTSIRFWADELVMSDGTRLAFPYASQYGMASGTPGAGGLDTGAIGTGWYELHAIAREDGTRNGLLHAAPVVAQGQAATVTSSNENFRDTSSTQSVAQSFVPSSTQTLFSCDFVLIGVGTVPNNNIWCTLHADNAGAPATAELARSNSIATSLLATSASAWFRFLFPTRPSLTSGTTYWIRVQSDIAVSASNYLRIYGNAASGYASGQALRYNGSTWSAMATLADLYFVTLTIGASTALTLPTGYTKSALIGHAYYDSGSYGGFHEFYQRGRNVQWLSPQTLLSSVGAANVPVLTDLSVVTPPYLPVGLQCTVYNNTGAQYTALMLGVPDGAGAAASVRGPSQAVILSNGEYIALPPFHTEGAACYVYSGATANFRVDIYGWDW